MEIRRDVVGEEEEEDWSESLPVDDTSDDDSTDNDLRKGREEEDGPSTQGCDESWWRGVLWLGSVWRQEARRSLHSPDRRVLSLQSGSPSRI